MAFVSLKNTFFVQSKSNVQPNAFSLNTWLSELNGVPGDQLTAWRASSHGVNKKTRRGGKKWTLRGAGAQHALPLTHTPTHSSRRLKNILQWEFLAPRGIMSCLRRQAQLSRSQELLRIARVQKMIQTNAKMLGMLRRIGFSILADILWVNASTSGSCESLCWKMGLAWVAVYSVRATSGFLGRSVANLKKIQVGLIKGLSELCVRWFRSDFHSLYTQVWRVTRTSSSCSKGETSSRCVPRPGRRPASSSSRRTARRCGTSRRNWSRQTRPVSTVLSSPKHVCETWWTSRTHLLSDIVMGTTNSFKTADPVFAAFLWVWWI